MARLYREALTRGWYRGGARRGTGEGMGADGQQLLAELRELEVFAAFDAEALDALATSITPMLVHGGEVLMRQGDEADSAYVVQCGRLRILVTGADGVARSAGEVGRGEMVGEMAL